MAGSRIRISIVILNYNRLEETRHTVTYLRELIAGRTDTEVIAVDNGSSDGTGSYLNSQSDFLTPVMLAENRGVGAYAAGFERGKGDYLLVLDDDSHPRDGVTLDRLIEQLDSVPKTGVVACRIEDGNGKRISTWHLPRQDRKGSSMAFVGCGFAIRRRLFEEIGWYAEHFFLYQNDVDVAFQVYLRGFSIVYDPGCRVVHRLASANRRSNRPMFYAPRHSLWLIRLYYTWPGKAYLLASRALIGLVRGLQFVEPGAYLRGLREGLSAPVDRRPLPARLRTKFVPFWRQNSILHQVLRRQ